MDTVREQKSTFRRWLYWFVPGLFYFFQTGIQALPSLTHDYVQGHYLLNELQIAFISMSFLSPYIFLQIPSGIIYDLFNSRKILGYALLIYIIGFVCLYLADTQQLFSLYLSGMFLQGIASSVSCLGTIYMANQWLSENEFKLANSLMSMMGILGFLLLSLLFNWSFQFINFSTLLVINGLFSLILFLLVWFLIEDKGVKQRFEYKQIMNNIKRVLFNRLTIILAIFNGCLFANIALLANLWRVHFLETHFYITRSQAILDNGYSLFGFMIGSFFYGIVSQRFKNITLLMFLSAVGSFISFFICHYLINDIQFKVYFYFVMGFFSSAIVLSLTIIKDKVAPAVLASTTGAVLMIQKLLGMLLIPLMGYLFQLTNQDYMLATLPVVFMAFVGVLCGAWLWLRLK